MLPHHHPTSPRRLLDSVDVNVSEGWLQNMRSSAAADPGRAARLMMAGAASRAPVALEGLVPEAANEAAATASGRCVMCVWADEAQLHPLSSCKARQCPPCLPAHPRPPLPPAPCSNALAYSAPAKLATPPKSRSAAAASATAAAPLTTKVPPLKLGGAASSSTAAAADENAATNIVSPRPAAMAAAGDDPKAAAKQQPKKGGGSLRFLPGRKVSHAGAGDGATAAAFLQPSSSLPQLPHCE